MTAVVDFTSLQSAIAEWLFGRTDLAGYYTAFIAGTEQRINFGTSADAPFPSEPLRVRDMITTTDLTLTSGAATLPTDFLEVERVTALTDPRTKLEFATSDWQDQIYPDTTASDPAFYTILGSSLIVRPVTTSQVELAYYQQLPALSDSQTTNWLILKAPNAYLYGACLEASVFMADEQSMARAQVFYGLFMGAIGGLLRSNRRAMAGTQPSRRASGAVA